MKRFKKGLLSAAALSLAVAFGSATMISAYAKNGNTNTPGISIDIVKTIYKNQNTPIPQEDVVFTITPATQADINVSSYNGNPIYPGVAGVFPATVSITPDTNTTANIQSVNPIEFTNHATLTPTATANTFPRAGIYRYVVEEQAPTVDGLELTPNSTPSYYLDVYVTNDVTTNVLSISDILAWNSGKAGGTTTNPTTFKVDRFDFSNTYTTHNLTIDNYITGNAADTSLIFTYNLSVKTSEQNQILYVLMPDGSYQTITAVNGVATLNGLQLGQNQKFEIFGLSANDEFTVTQTPVADYSLDIGLASGDKTDDTPDAATGTLTGKVTTTNDVWNFVNYRQGTVPTAFFTTYGPYVAGVVVLGGLGYAMFRKKKDNE